MEANATTRPATMNDQPYLRPAPQPSRPQPVTTFELFFPVVGAVWRNENAEGRAWYSATLERRYKDQDGRWQSGGSWSADDLLILQKVAGLCHTEIYRLRAADRDAGREPGQEG